MKRCFSLALILALLGTTATAPALAEEPEVVSESVEAPVSEVELLGDIDLAIESEAEAPEQTATEAIGESPVDISTEDAAVLAADLDDATYPQDDEEDAVSDEDTADSAKGAVAAAATEIQLSAKSITIGVKEDYKGLTAIALPEGSTLPKVSWRSGNTKVAKVNSSTGVVTGVRTGSAKIYAKMAGSKKEVVCKVTVKKKPKKVSLKTSSKTLGKGFDFKLKPSVPSGYACGAFKFKSSKKSVATVDSNGVVTAVAPGTATITVSTYNNKTAKCKVTVLDAPATAQFPDEILPLAVDQTVELSVTALTSKGKATPAVVTFAIDESSPDAGCVKLDEATGKLTGVRKGEAIIRATSHNGVIAYCVAEVDVAPASISLNASKVSIGVKEDYVNLLAELTAPSGAGTCAQSVTWSSSNKKIAKVDSHTGIITGVKAGSCTIKVATPNGKTAKCKVTVLKAPTKKTVSISPSNGALKVGQSGQYKISMSKGYGGSLTYESKNTAIATVDSNGVVTAVAPGTTKITVTTYNGVQKSASLVVNGDSISSSDDGKAGTTNADKIDYVIQIAKSKKGKPYVYGSFGPNSFDCSGFVYWCFKQINIKLKDSAYKQGYDNSYAKISYSDLKPGDVVVFNTVKDSDLSDHTGIYIGNYQFIHASSSAKKVIISSLKDGYYKRNFSWGRRILD